MPASVNYFLCTTLVLSILSCSQKKNVSNNRYTVDKSIAAEVEKFTTRENEMILGQMDVRLLENDLEVQNTFGTEKKLPFFINTTAADSVVFISGVAGLFSVFGFELFIKKNSFDVFFHVATDDPTIYKLNKSDTTYKTGVMAPAVNSKLTLSQAADPQKISRSQPLAGCLELESKEFYQKSYSDKEDKKIKVFIKAYFKTDQVNRPGKD